MRSIRNSVNDDHVTVRSSLPCSHAHQLQPSPCLRSMPVCCRLLLFCRIVAAPPCPSVVFELSPDVRVYESFVETAIAFVTHAHAHLFTSYLAP